MISWKKISTLPMQFVQGFILEITKVNLNVNRKERGLEVSNQLHAKALGERLIGGAGRPSVGRSACTCGQISWPFYRCAGLVYTIPGKLIRLKWWKDVGRPAWYRPPGLTSLPNLLEFFWNVSFALLVWIHCALGKKSEQGCGWHTHVHQPQEHKEEQTFVFIFIRSKVGCCCIQLNELNKWNKGI